MARPLRIQFPGAIYHVMARGNCRQVIFRDDDDYQRMTDGLEKTVVRTGWEVFSYVWMPNHIHLFFRTPQPNLSKGMQYLLSGYANWYFKRHRVSGHLFQGRFKGELIEDDSYFWNVSRYLHLNPVRGKRPLVNHPKKWPWSSFTGFASARHRLPFIDYQSVLDAWAGEMGGKNPDRAYCRFVESGVTDQVVNPFVAAWEGWLLGSAQFVERIKTKMSKPKQPDQVRMARRLGSPNPRHFIAAVAKHYRVRVEDYRSCRSTAKGRDLAAYLAHRHTTATLRELANCFGVHHPDSVSNLVRRASRELARSPGTQAIAERIVARVFKTENRV